MNAILSERIAHEAGNFRNRSFANAGPIQSIDVRLTFYAGMLQTLVLVREGYDLEELMQTIADRALRLNDERTKMLEDQTK